MNFRVSVSILYWWARTGQTNGRTDGPQHSVYGCPEGREGRI